MRHFLEKTNLGVTCKVGLRHKPRVQNILHYRDKYSFSLIVFSNNIKIAQTQKCYHIRLEKMRCDLSIPELGKSSATIA